LDLMVAGTGTGNQFDWPGGDGVLDVDATFGGGSVALQKLSQSGAWLAMQNYATVTPISLTANGTANFRAAAGPIRVVATTATAVNAYATGVPANVAG
jgi:hypothetical protein